MPAPGVGCLEAEVPKPPDQRIPGDWSQSGHAAC
jgi:hypothetical protein